MDAISMHTFLSSWAETMRGRFDELTTLPNFTLGKNALPGARLSSSAIYAHVVTLQEMASMLEMFLLSDGSYNTATRRFLFKNETIKTLYDRAKSEEVARPTRYESLSAFLWKHIMEASKKVHGSRRPLPCTTGHVVNTRRRMDPPQGNHCMCNFLVLATANHSGNIEFPEIVKRTHKCIEEVNNEALKLMEGEKCHEVISEIFSKAKGEVTQIDGDKTEFVLFTSWCNMGFYELDFGWGKPNWVGICGQGEARSGTGNIIYFVETNSRDGIEVTMTLEDKKMVALENDPQFLKFAIPNPSAPKT